jgi:hypothetical protein
MQLHKAIAGAIQKLKNTRYDLQRVSRLVNDPKLSRTYYPEAERKSKTEIRRENLLWLARNKEVNRYYYVYGLDRKDTDASEVLPYRTFRAIRDSTNQHPNTEGYTYVCLLRDKFVFAQFLTSLHFPTPRNLALLNQNEITWLETMSTVPLDSLITTDRNVDGFCKKLTGIMGEGAFSLRLSDRQLYIKETEITIEQLRNELKGQYLLQERLEQHPQMRALHPDSVNTMRIITFNNKGVVSVFAAALRIGTHGRSVDNWASGGVVIGINLETGKLRKEGFLKPGYGGRVQQHPDSGITLEGFQIPFFPESIDMVCQLHRYFYGVHSIGWDIAITPDGPVFIEGNDDWEGGIPMVLEKNFKSRFLKMFPNNGADVNLRHIKTQRIEPH